MVIKIQLLFRVGGEGSLVLLILVSLPNRTAGSQEDGRTLVCDKRDKAISYVFCRDLHLTSMFSGLLQKDLFKGR